MTNEFTIAELVKAAHRIATYKEFWDDETPNIGEKIALIHSELSEALEEVRAGHKPNEIYEVDGKPEGLPIELADAVIRIADLCGYYKIDLADAIYEKLNYNARRPIKHGKQF